MGVCRQYTIPSTNPTCHTNRLESSTVFGSILFRRIGTYGQFSVSRPQVRRTWLVAKLRPRQGHGRRHRSKLNETIRVSCVVYSPTHVCDCGKSAPSIVRLLQNAQRHALPTTSLGAWYVRKGYLRTYSLYIDHPGLSFCDMGRAEGVGGGGGAKPYRSSLVYKRLCAVGRAGAVQRHIQHSAGWIRAFGRYGLFPF